MNLLDAQRLVHERFADQWVYTDVAFGEDGYQPSGTTNEYIRLRVYEDATENTAVGAALDTGPGRVTHSGRIVGEIRVRLNVGTTRAKELGGQVSDIFQNQRFGDASEIRCYACRVVDEGQLPSGWYQVTATVDFEFDERKPA